MATQTLFTLSSRQFPAGAFTSPTYAVPAGISTVTAAFTIAAPDISDPTKTLAFECDRFNVASGLWEFDHGFTWQGNSLNKLGQPSSPTISVDGLTQGTQLRAIITPNAPLTTALLVTAQ